MKYPKTQQSTKRMPPNKIKREVPIKPGKKETVDGSGKMKGITKR
jgi:hypothetical protein